MANKNLSSKSLTKSPQYDMRDILNGKFSFSSRIRISKNSLYTDDIWDWNDDSNPRLSLNRPNTLKIKWNKYSSDGYLPEKIIEDLKRISCLIFFFGPQLFGTRKELHPRSLCSELKNLIRFLHLIVRQFTVSNISIVKTLADIEVEDLKSNISKVKANTIRISLKKMLKHLANPFLKNVMACGSLKWTTADINKMDWKISHTNQNNFDRLPAGMFKLFSEAATEDIKLFLHYLEINPFDKTNTPGLLRRIDKESSNSISKGLIFDYIQYRRSIRKKILSKNYKNMRHLDKERILKAAALLNRTRLAAQIIILLYTGSRSSEVRTFKFENFRREGDYWYLFGTVQKQRDIHAPINQDRWIAIRTCPHL